MRISESILAWGCGGLLIACGGNSHRLGGEPDGGAAEGGTGGTTSSMGGQGGDGVGNASNGGTGIVSNGGTAGTSSGGPGGTSGTAGTGAVMGCEQALPDQSLLGCDAETAMRQHCARGGCHNTTTRSGNLDLTLDSLLIARVLDVPARFATTSRDFGPCIQATCPGSALLVDSAAPESSWMLKKMAAFDFETPSSAPDMGCGTAMPYPPGGMGFTSERHECLRSFFLAIAEFGVPCSGSSESPPELPTCPEPE